MADVKAATGDMFDKKFLFPLEPVVEISADNAAAIRKRIKKGVRRKTAFIFGVYCEVFL
jgi:hypothetical protein